MKTILTNLQNPCETIALPDTEMRRICKIMSMDGQMSPCNRLVSGAKPQEAESSQYRFTSPRKAFGVHLMDPANG
jgi:hypothetical protein